VNSEEMMSRSRETLTLCKHDIAITNLCHGKSGSFGLLTLDPSIAATTGARIFDVLTSVSWIHD
jgi:hypothetical protein